MNYELKIYDLSGRIVRSFPLLTSHSSLLTSVTWDGRDKDGKPVPSGVYFARLKSGDKSLTGKLVLIR